MMSFDMPYIGTSFEEIKERISRDKVKFRSVNWRLRDCYALDFIRKGLRKNPEDRPTCREMLEHPYLNRELCAQDYYNDLLNDGM